MPDKIEIELKLMMIYEIINISTQTSAVPPDKRNTVIDFGNIKPDELSRLKSVFEKRLMQLLDGRESLFLENKCGQDTKRDLKSKYHANKGRKLTTYKGITNEEFSKLYDSIIANENQENFRLNTAKLAQSMARETNLDKGLFIFLKFSFIKIRGKSYNAVAIFGADYLTKISRLGQEEILENLTEVFNEDFKYVALYPYVQYDEEGKLKFQESKIITYVPKSKASTDKIYESTFHSLGTEKPPSYKEYIYDELLDGEYPLSDISDFQLLSTQNKELIDIANAEISLSGFEAKIPLSDILSKKVFFFCSPKGEGIFFPKKTIDIKFNNHNLVGSSKIKKIDWNDLMKDD